MATITKYKLQISENSFVEFSTLQAASDYKSANSISYDVEQVEEEQAAAKPAMYITIEKKIGDAQSFGNQLILEFGRENLLLGYTIADVKSVLDKTSKVIAMLQTGSMYTALDELSNIEPDARLTPERITAYANKIRAYLGLPLL